MAKAGAWNVLSSGYKESLAIRFRSGEDLSEELSKLGIKQKTLRNRVAEYERTKLDLGISLVEALPNTPQREYLDQKIIHTDNVLISSDWEIPDEDRFMTKAQLCVAMKYNLRRIVVNGDLISNDIPGINSYMPLFAEDIPSTHFITQNQTARHYIRTFRKWFTKGIYLTYGNHENKMNRATKGVISVDDILYAEDIDITHYAHLWLKTSRGWAHVSHPSNYSKDSVSLGRKLYNKTVTPDGGKPSFMFVGHTHQAQSGHSEDGLCEIYGLGCNRNANATAYTSRSVNTHPQWSQSFAIILDGYVKVFDRKKTNWKAELGDTLYEELMK